MLRTSNKNLDNQINADRKTMEELRSKISQLVGDVKSEKRVLERAEKANNRSCQDLTASIDNGIVLDSEIVIDSKMSETQSFHSLYSLVAFITPFGVSRAKSKRPDGKEKSKLHWCDILNN